ncbi:arginine N-succinyltransferase [Marinobacterium nitratireducens]|uniref:Arginine N-succinyltransferase n=1 Tax=Marinobacterium nitratireducens TaxID=518897 RepID=A0A917ZC64_9GAMM|nr:arginine N-succinyltransferase [Marinobacterium nitratireducens]GGO79043.1 arginine N-succinyltransferase [Marinobacterium nitratireducens]
MIIRPIRHDDLDALYRIAVESGPGFSSLPDDPDVLRNKIQHSIESFARKVQTPNGESYLFVLQDADTGAVMGTTGIESSIGLHQPLYHYHHSQEEYRSRDLGISSHVGVLNLGSHYSGCSEICTLYLRPQYRRLHAGKLLSKVRFLFMAQHPQRFADTVIAEMRGVSDEAGRSPFWDWMRQHFLDMDFATVTRLVGSGNNGFVSELMPRYPLYTQLLSAEARRVIGEVHDKTRPALKLLQAEGFEHRGFVDPFDAGPTVEAKLTQIRSIATSVACRVEIATDQRRLETEPEHLCILANTSVDSFRAGIAEQMHYRAEDGVLEISRSLAGALKLSAGAQARFVQLPLSGSRVADTAFAVQNNKEPIHAR